MEALVIRIIESLAEAWRNNDYTIYGSGAIGFAKNMVAAAFALLGNPYAYLSPLADRFVAFVLGIR